MKTKLLIGTTDRRHRRLFLPVWILCLALAVMPGVAFAATSGSNDTPENSNRNSYAENAAGMTRIRLTADNVWGDDTGYQILLFDAGYIPDDLINIQPNDNTLYDAAIYKIPSDADATDDHVVVTGSAYIDIPAGSYDYLVLNPGCAGYGTIYVASAQTDPSRGKSVAFEAGKQYEFSLSLLGQNDSVAITDSIISILYHFVEAADSNYLALTISNVSLLEENAVLVVWYSSSGRMQSMERLYMADFSSSSITIQKNGAAMVKVFLLDTATFAPIFASIQWIETP